MIRYPKSKRFGLLFVLPLVIIVATYMVFPFFYNAIYSTFDWNGIDPQKTFIGFANYVNLFQDQVFLVTIKNFCLFGFFTIFFQALFGLVLASFLKDRFWGRDLFKSVIFLPGVLSAVIIGNIFFRLLDPNIGYFNIVLKNIGLDFLAKSWLSDVRYAIWACIAIQIWQWTGYSLTMYYAGIKAIPEDLFEVARIDGADKKQLLFFVTLPLLRSTTYGLVILGAISTLKQFDLIYTLTRGGPANSTQMFALYMYNVSFGMYKQGYACAIAMFMFVFAMIITIFQLKLYNKHQLSY